MDGLTEHALDRRDGRLYYRRVGQGPPLVLLHAAPQAGWSWDKVLPALAVHFTCYVPDLPGFDHSDQPPRSYGIDDFTDAVLELLDGAGLARAHFVGSHTGAVVSLNLAARRPERVDRLVLEDSPGWTADEGRIIFERFFAPRFAEDGLPRLVSYEEAARDHPELDRDKHERCLAILRRSRAWVRVCQEANTGFDVQRIMGAVRAPTLVVFAAEDPLRRREQRFLDEIRGARLWVPDGSRSEAHWDTPDAFAREVSAFLRGADSQPDGAAR